MMTRWVSINADPCSWHHLTDLVQRRDKVSASKSQKERHNSFRFVLREEAWTNLVVEFQKFMANLDFSNFLTPISTRRRFGCLLRQVEYTHDVQLLVLVHSPQRGQRQ
jgi:hypothetical protein